MSGPVRALLLFDLLRLREFARRLKGDLWSATVVGLLVGGGAAALLVGLERLGRERLAEAPGLGAAAGAVLGAAIVMAQRQAARRMTEGPFGLILADSKVRTLWSAARALAVALVAVAALALGALRGGGTEAALAPLAGLALAAALALAVPDLEVPALEVPPAKARPSRGPGAPIRLALRARTGGLPRWALIAAFVAAAAALARLAEANGNPVAVHALLFAAAWACGALAAPGSDLFAFLARTPRPLGRLLLDFAVAPAGAGLLAGVAAAAVPGAGAAEAAAVGAGVVACALALTVAHLNRLAYGPVAGPPRLTVYAGLAAVGALALGPFVVLFVAAGLVLLARTAARRRWSAA